MSQFDAIDVAGSASLDGVLADPVSYQPTVPRSGGDRITITKGRNTATYDNDPAREARPRQGETGFVAIVTWKSYAMGASDIDGTHRDAIMANDVMLDFSRRLFATPHGEQLPRSGDLFWLPANGGGTIPVQQTRDCFDDGGDRIVLYCIAPTG